MSETIAWVLVVWLVFNAGFISGAYWHACVEAHPGE
jgi:hypothetical protein